MFDFLNYLLKDLRGNGIESIEIGFNNTVTVKFDEIGFLTAFADCKNDWQINEDEQHGFYTVSVCKNVIVAELIVSNKRELNVILEKAGYGNGKNSEEIVGD